VPRRAWRGGAKLPVVNFTERLQRREQLWWHPRPRLGAPTSWVDVLHAEREKRRHRSRDDAARRWECCDKWPRQLVAKWNSREFAASFGATVPELLGRGHDTKALSRRALPPRFAVRPERGANSRGVLIVVDGRELLQDEAIPAGADLGAFARSRHTAGRYLIEEFISRSDNPLQLPVEYKCHTFGPVVRGIEVLDHDSPGPDRLTKGYFRPDWSQFDDRMDSRRPPIDPTLPPPPFLGEMIDLSAKMGSRIGTYMRIDYFFGPSGLVFNEFASAPNIRRPMYTPYCNEIFGQYWDEDLGDRV
jgi:hypothetical protein